MSNIHQIQLQGPALKAGRLSGHMFRDVLDVLVEGSERALRLRIEGKSTSKGTTPRWLKAASDFTLITGPTATGTGAHVEGQPLLETMSDRFHAGEFFADLDPRKSPLDLFEDAVADAIAGNEDSDKIDAGLVKTIERFSGVLEQGLTKLELINGRTLTIDRMAMDKVHALVTRSHAAQRVRLAGRLETIRYSDCRFVLKLEAGGELQGTAVDLGHDVLRTHFGHNVTVTGLAVFRPSGKPLRIEAERLDAASERDTKLWSALPRPLLGPMDGRSLKDEQRSKGGLGQFLGRWPGEESDAEVAVALQAIS